MNHALGIPGLPRDKGDIETGAVLHHKHSIVIKDETACWRYALDSNAIVLGLSSEFRSLYDLQIVKARQQNQESRENAYQCPGDPLSVPIAIDCMQVASHDVIGESRLSL